MVCAPRELLRPMTPRSQNISRRLFSFSSSWRSRTLPLSAKISMSVMVLIFLTIPFITAFLGSPVLIGRPIALSSFLPRRQNASLLTGFLFIRTPLTPSANGRFERKPKLSVAKNLAKAGCTSFLHDGQKSHLDSAGPLQLPLHPQFTHPHHFTPGPHTANLHVPYWNPHAPYSYPHP